MMFFAAALSIVFIASLRASTAFGSLFAIACLHFFILVLSIDFSHAVLKSLFL